MSRLVLTTQPTKILVDLIACVHNEVMKITDDYQAKLEIWAREGKAVRMPQIANFPKFGHRRFNSYAELNAWKQSLMDEFLKQGGVKWTK